MNYSKKLTKLINKNDGIISSKIVDEKGIPRVYLSDFVKKGVLERVDRGIYISTNSFDDEMYRLQIKYSQIIFSHETALYFNELTDRDPGDYSVTVKAGYNSTNIKRLGIKVYSIKDELYSLGIITVKNQFGNEIKIYNKERTICDILRSRSQIDIDIISEAVKRYTKLEGKNIPELLKLSKLFKVNSILRNYLEVLL